MDYCGFYYSKGINGREIGDSEDSSSCETDESIALSVSDSFVSEGAEMEGVDSSEESSPQDDMKSMDTKAKIKAINLKFIIFKPPNTKIIS